jgi:hypothetical protein
MASELRRAKKAFNVVSIALIDQLLAMFKGEPVLSFFRGEIEKFAADPKTAHVPAANYFGTMNVATKIKPVVGEGSDPEAEVVVGELVVCRDDRLFGPDCGVVVPALEALGLKAKWPKLSPAEKEMVWGYLGRLATHAAQVVVGMQMSDPKMRAALEQLSKEGGLQPGATAAEYAKAAERAKTVLKATASLADRKQ